MQHNLDVENKGGENMSNEIKKKIKFSGKINCPYCNKSIVMEAGDEIITPSEPAEKKPFVIVKKDMQQKL